MNELIENIFRAVQSCPVDRLPRVLGMLAEISETCRARLAGAGTPAQTQDELLTISQAAERLQVSHAYLYKNTSLPFRKKLGRSLRFSANGITEYLQRQR
ncbi:MAG: helix-turn-helix domain-containing protein [Candidatus Sulfotelmatobacter sp.]